RGVDDGAAGEARAGDRADGAIERELRIELAPEELVDPAALREVVGRLVEGENLDTIGSAVRADDDHHRLRQCAHAMGVEVREAAVSSSVTNDELIVEIDAARFACLGQLLRCEKKLLTFDFDA